MTSTRALAQRLVVVERTRKKSQMWAKKLQSSRIEFYDGHTGEPLECVPDARIRLPVKCPIDCPRCRGLPE